MDLNTAMLNLSLIPSEFPSVAPSAASDFVCVERGPDYPSFPYICYPRNIASNYGVDERLVESIGLNDSNNTDSIYPLFVCRTNILADDIPNSEDCDSFCLLQYAPATGTKSCSSCSLVGTELVYDCRNVIDASDNNVAVATPSCAARNSEGVCGDFVHWQCFPQGLGYGCVNNNRAWLDAGADPVFPFDNVSNSQVTLFCASDMSGLPTSACEQPKCNIGRTEPTMACGSCQVLANKNDTHPTRDSPYDFAYDCESFPNLTCPILDKAGNCINRVYENETNNNIRGISFPEDTSNEEDTGSWTWTIINIDPTTFNVLSDLVGYVTRILFGIAMATFFPVLMAWQLKTTPVPVQALWPAPGDFFLAIKSLRLFACSLPAIVLVVVLFFGDFCHTLADLGFDFVDQSEPGPMQPILKISGTTEGRNMARALDTSGDPGLARTTATNVAIEDGRVNESREQTALRTSFLSATTLIARGSSPFVLEAPRPWRETLNFGGIWCNTFFMPDDSPVAVLEEEIPLDCSSTELAAIPEAMFGFPVYDEPIYNTALVPNCTFTGIRSSGVFGRELGFAEIVEHIDYTGIAPDIDGIDTGEGILLRRANETFQKFTLTPSQKLLARDRDDWKTGRVVDDAFDGLEIGNVTIDLGRVVVATGGDAANGLTVYAFVSQIDGDCPERPSGLSAASTECLAILLRLAILLKKTSRLITTNYMLPSRQHRSAN